MSLMMIVVAGGLALALLVWALRRNGSSPAAPNTQAILKVATPQVKAVLREVPTEAPKTVPPPELASFRWLAVRDLDAARREALLEAVKGIPRPPHALQKLLSPEFVTQAGSAELSELVMGEPMIAAKILSTVNAPFYGLHQPVSGIGQAVTFLGMNTVRSICVQYMLADAFKPRLANSQKTFDGIWRASAIASELCVRLSKELHLPDQGSLSTQVVLGFVGHLSAASLMSPAELDNWLTVGRLERVRREQDVMTLSAAEIGGLLMHTWGLPGTLVNAVSGVDKVLVTPPSNHPTAEAPRLALCYLCARLGERLANGQLASLEGYDPFQDIGLDTFYLNQHLCNPMLRQLPAALASAEVQNAMHQMLTGEPK